MSSDTIALPPHCRSRLLGGAGGELTLAVLTDEHQGQEIRIRGPKCTIGSARGCTLRLRARGVAAVHCWILRGAGGTVVRRRHRNTQLNGQAFDDAPLKPGDRLRLGSVELEVRQCPVAPPDWTEATALPAPAYDEVDRQLWERTAQVSAETIDRLQAELQELQRRAASQLAEQTESCTRLSAERDALRDQLQQLESGTASGNHALAAEKQELEAALAADRQTLAELRSQTAVRQAELEEQLRVESRRMLLVQSRLDDVLSQRAELEAKLQDQLNKVHGPNVDRQAELERLREECHRLNDQMAQLRELLGYTSSDRDRALQQIQETQNKLLKQQQQLEHEKQQLVQHLDQTKSEKTAAEAQLRAESVTWQSERDRLHANQERTSEHSRQLEGQLAHVRELVETLAAERDSLCQQLEAADLKQSSEHETFQAQRAAMEERLSSGQQQVSAIQNHLAELSEQLAAQKQRGEQAEGELAAQTARADRAERQLAELQADGTRLTAKFSGQPTRDEGGERRLADLEAELAAKAEGLAKQSQRAENLDRELAQARHEVASNSQLLAVQTQRIEKSERLLAEAQATSDSAAAALAEAERRIQELESASVAQVSSQGAQQVRDELAAAQTQLADSLARLEAERAAGQAHARREHDQRLEWERRAGELQYQLAATELKVTDAENRLEAARAQSASAASVPPADASELQELNDKVASLVSENERLRAESSRVRQRQVEAAESNAAREGIEKQLADFKELVQAEREALHRDRDRAQQECRVLGHKLIQKQKELDALHEQVRAATAAQSDPSRQTAGTITMAQIHRQFEAAAAVEEQRNTWFGERDQLRREIDDLRKQLTEGPAEDEEATLGRDEVTKLRMAITGTRAAEPLALLRPAAGHSDADLEAERQSLTAERAQLAAQQEQLAAEREQVESIQRETEARRAQLQAMQDELESRSRDWEEMLREKERLLDERARELVDKLGSSDALPQSPPPVEPAAPVSGEQEAALQAAQATIAQLQEELNRLRVQREQSEAQAEQADSEPSHSAAGNQDAGDVEHMLTKLVETGVWQGDGPAAGIARIPEVEALSAENVGASQSASVPEHCAPQFAAEAPPADAPQDAPKPVWNQPDAAAPPDDDDSIEAYMSRLLKRVRGDAPGGVPNFAPAMAPVAPPPKAVPPAQKAAAPTPRPASPKLAAIPEPEPEPVKPQEYVPRQKAPEHSTNLQAMRDLANSAARGAIVKAQKRSGNQQALIKSMGAAMTLTCAAGAGYWAWRTNSLPATAAAAIGLIVAVYWGGKAAGQAFRAMLLTPQMLKGKTLIRRKKDPPLATRVKPQDDPPAAAPIAGGESLPLELIPTEQPPPAGGETLSAD
jgi:chromosome segregation ATPase